MGINYNPYYQLIIHNAQLTTTKTTITIITLTT